MLNTSNKSKKFLGAILTLVLVTTSMPAFAFAEDTVVETTPSYVPNTCVVPDKLSDSNKVDIKNLNNETRTLQVMLDEIASGIDAMEDQQNYQVWNVASASTTLEIKYQANGAGGPIVFGYYTAGDTTTFVPMFKTGDYEGFESVQTLSLGQSASTVVSPQAAVSFGIKSNDTGKPFFSTENSKNADGVRHAVVYNLESTSTPTSHIVGFEDLTNLGDHDYNDILVVISARCDNNGGGGGPPPAPANHLPTITLLGDNPMNILEGSVFVDPGATATDTEDGDLTANIVKTGSVNTSIVGGYTLSYSVSDSAGASASVNRVVNVLATLPINISKTANKTSAFPGDFITYTVTVNNQGDNELWHVHLVDQLPSTLIFDHFISNPGTTTPDTNLISWDGSHMLPSETIVYSYVVKIKDDVAASTTITNNFTSRYCFGNNGCYQAPNVSASVLVVAAANTPPVINLIGNNPLDLFVGQSFTDPGATATDTEDGNLTSQIIVTGSVNTSTTSASTLVYLVTDSGGLSASTTRMVIVSATTTATTTPPVNPPIVNPPSGGGGGGGGIGGHRRDISNLLATTTRGQVLGVTSCSYLRDYLRRDWNNDKIEVLKLQSFLNVFEGEKLSYTTVFDEPTFQAVSRFQNKYFNDILAPWGHTAPTGFVYILTKKKINEIYCNTVYTLTPEQQQEIASFRTFLQSLRAGGGATPDVSSTVGLGDRNDSVAGTLNMTGATGTDEERDGILANNILRNAAVSLFSISESWSPALKWLFLFLIMLAAIYAIYSFLNSGKQKDKIKQKTPDSDLPPPTISYDKSLEELVDDIVKKEELKEILLKEKEGDDSKKGFKGILDE